MTPAGAAPPGIFHITTPAAWAAAQASGAVVPAGFAAEGFVHCSTEEQLTGSIWRHFADQDDLVLLRLDPDAIAADLRWEEGRPGEAFPHVYRPLRLADVAEVVPWSKA